METINKRDLIPIFKKSRLVDQFEDVITVPKKYVFRDFKTVIQYKIEIEINDDKCFYRVMDQLRYFMFEELPYEIYDYVLKYKPDLSNFKDFFFEELTLLKDNKIEKIINECAKKGYLNLMKYLRENGCRCSWNSYTCDLAAKNGNLDCLKYLHENGCSWDELTCYWAAENGHLDCLKYLHENGCSWDEWTCYSAVRKGHLDCLKYAIENNCNFFRQKCIDKARENDHEHVVEYLENLDHYRLSR